MAQMTTQGLRRLIERDESRCVFCQRFVEWDPPADPNDPRQVGDWNYAGDYGCDDNPASSIEGTAGHLTAEDVAAMERGVEDAIEALAGSIPDQDGDADVRAALAALRL